MKHQFNHPVTEVIRSRFSCRRYREVPIDEQKQASLREKLSDPPASPFSNPIRFKLVAASENDHQALRRLGTYGFIHGASAFIIGAVRPQDRAFENFGYLMEYIILHATDLDLGTCWLGGSFTRSRFNRAMGLEQDEVIPAVTAVGYVDDIVQARNGFIRKFIHAHQRRAWQSMFWNGGFKSPLSPEEAGRFAEPLEMVRLGPSASNRQPWQIVKNENHFHFYLRRTDGYADGWISRMLQQSDLQRVDLGIAMCHFELTSRALGMDGEWIEKEPDIEKPMELADLIEYTASWRIK